MVTGIQGLTWCVRSNGCHGCYGALVHVQLGCGSAFRRLNNGAFCLKCLIGCNFRSD